jgi:hypothetical protein
MSPKDAEVFLNHALHRVSATYKLTNGSECRCYRLGSRSPGQAATSHSMCGSEVIEAATTK